jgi:hypothetical protein
MPPDRARIVSSSSTATIVAPGSAAARNRDNPRSAASRPLFGIGYWCTIMALQHHQAKCRTQPPIDYLFETDEVAQRLWTSFPRRRVRDRCAPSTGRTARRRDTPRSGLSRSRGAEK